MTEIHARWYGKNSSTFCGVRGEAVTIRTPADWARVNCATCSYAALKEES